MNQYRHREDSPISALLSSSLHSFICWFDTFIPVFYSKIFIGWKNTNLLIDPLDPFVIDRYFVWRLMFNTWLVSLSHNAPHCYCLSWPSIMAATGCIFHRALSRSRSRSGPNKVRTASLSIFSPDFSALWSLRSRSDRQPDSVQKTIDLTSRQLAHLTRTTPSAGSLRSTIRNTGFTSGSSGFWTSRTQFVEPCSPALFLNSNVNSSKLNYAIFEWSLASAFVSRNPPQT